MSIEKLPPNWGFWAKLNTVGLWQAVMLSLGVEPNPEFLKVRQDFSRPGVAGPPGGQEPLVVIGFSDDEMRKRYVIAVNHAAPGGGLAPLSRQKGGDPADYAIGLRRFGSWANELGLEIPLEFPRDDSLVAVRMESRIVIDLPYKSTKLIELLHLAKECYGDLENPPKQLDVSLRIQRDFRDESADKGTTASDFVAAILRPDPLRDPDNRATKASKRHRET